MPSKHTPGPWVAELQGNDWKVSHEWEGGLAFVAEQPIRSQRNPEKTEANARLIAAAPDLLEALRYVADWGATDPDAPRDEDVREIARAAIRKAEGE
jgi:hypothetical protein